MQTPSYKNLHPASRRSSTAARGSSKKYGTIPELLLRRALWRSGYRYRKNVPEILGNPDLVFIGPRVVVFCDGDFWHGKSWQSRREKLVIGHNPNYWVAKIEHNMKRDKQTSRQLEEEGWRVIRVWESDIKRDLDNVVKRITQTLHESQRRDR